MGSPIPVTPQTTGKVDIGGFEVLWRKETTLVSSLYSLNSLSTVNTPYVTYGPAPEVLKVPVSLGSYEFRDCILPYHKRTLYVQKGVGTLVETY